MTSKHLQFEELLDLIDNVLDEKEKENCLNHIASCKECKEEYESLVRCMSLLSSLSKENLALPDFSKSTIFIYKNREKKKLLLKVIPAIAASVIMVTGIGFVKNGTFSKSNTNFAGNHDQHNIVEYIGHWKIVQVKHAYIDTEFDRGMLADIKTLLQQNKVKHTMVANPPIFENPLGKNMNYMTLAENKQAVDMDDLIYNNLPEDGKVRVRIYK